MVNALSRRRLFGFGGFALIVVAVLFAGLSCKTMKDPNKDAKEIDSAYKRLAVPDITARTNPDPLVMVHYMPWYQAPPVSQNFGWHWHMGYYDPYEADAKGKLPIASHYYPLTGPYDSRDPALIEYHLLSMKLAGIDGVIIDYYGIENALDYKDIHTASVALFNAVKKAGMKFAVCYEDQSIGKMIEGAVFPKEQALEYGKKAIKWMDDNWFQDPAYMKIEGRPVLMNFGPQFFKKNSEWEELFSVAKTKPFFIALDNHAESFADSLYPWMPMWMAPGSELSIGKVAEYLNTYYKKTRDRAHIIATAWPRFHDIYKEAEVAESYGNLKDLNGGTLKLTLDAAYESQPDAIQIATWNDHGEGTVVEPNEVYGYRDLTIIQEAKKKAQPAFAFGAKDLEIALKIYKLRQSGQKPELADRFAAAIFAGDKATFDRLVSQL